MKAAITLI